MDSYLACLRKYADFSGRARRREFWIFTLANMAIMFALLVIDLIIGGTNDNGNGAPSLTTALILLLLFLFYLAIVIPSVAVQVRRLHDIGKSGWWWFIQWVPIIGGIWLFILFLSESQPGSNQWGPNPKEIGAAVAAAS